jgi:hypothetical protein
MSLETLIRYTTRGRKFRERKDRLAFRPSRELRELITIGARTHLSRTRRTSAPAMTGGGERTGGEEGEHR